MAISGEGCWPRYNPSGSSVYTKNISLRGNGRYNDIPCQQDNSCSNNAQYGKWLRVDHYIAQGDNLNFTISGNVSLCSPSYFQNSRPIPLVDIAHEGGLPITLDPAKNKGYIYIVKVADGDKIKITVGPNSSSTLNVVDEKGNNKLIDCDKGLDGQGKIFHPSCNKFSPYVGARIVTSCKANQVLDPFSQCDDTWSASGCNNKPDNNDKRCQVPASCSCKVDGGQYCQDCSLVVHPRADVKGCLTGWDCKPKAFRYNSLCSVKTTESLPDTYSFDKVYIDNKKISTPQDLLSGDTNCAGIIDKADQKSWFAFQAKDINGKNLKTFSGLYYTITNAKTKNKLPSKALEIIEDDPKGPAKLDGSAPRTLDARVIFEDRIFNLPKGNKDDNYFATFFHNFQNSTEHTGGYVIYLKHTSCYRQDGEYWPVPYKDKGTVRFTNKGKIRYLILDDQYDPNKDTSLSDNAKILNFDKQNSDAVAYDNGYLWLRIENNLNDYKNSSGAYEISLTKTSSKPKKNDNNEGIFSVVTKFAKEARELSQQIFQNLICRGDSQKEVTCKNLFNSIKALLGIYVVILGIQFTLGMVKINQLEFFERIIKVIIVGGLINDNTFNFFNQYVFDLIFNAGDEIMGSINGMQGNVGQNLNRFFLEIYDKFTSEIFILQVAAQLSTGLTAVITVLIICMSVIMFLIVIMEFIFVYIMSYIGLAIMMSLAPIFLVFMLFKTTNYLFDNWVRFVVRYMFEPVIFFIGISVLTKIFLIYIDYVLGYSVCFKCALSFSVPFIGNIFPILKTLETMPLFCIYWYGPWGYDATNSNFVAGMSNIAALFIIAFTTFKYSSVSSALCSKIFGGPQSMPSAQKLASSVEKTLAQGIKSGKSS